MRLFQFHPGAPAILISFSTSVKFRLHKSFSFGRDRPMPAMHQNSITVRPECKHGLLHTQRRRNQHSNWQTLITAMLNEKCGFYRYFPTHQCVCNIWIHQPQRVDMFHMISSVVLNTTFLSLKMYCKNCLPGNLPFTNLFAANTAPAYRSGPFTFQDL